MGKEDHPPAACHRSLDHCSQGAWIGCSVNTSSDAPELVLHNAYNVNESRVFVATPM